MREMRSSEPTHFTTTHVESLASLAAHPPSLKVIDVDLTAVLYSLSASLAYFRTQEKDAHGFRGRFVATGSNARAFPSSSPGIFFLFLR